MLRLNAPINVKPLGWGGGGKPGIGGLFDVASLPVVGTFDHSLSCGGRDFLTLTVRRVGSTDTILADRHLE